MNVVTRSLMATGLLVYAGIHLLQVFDPPAAAPGWLRWAFLATSLLAIGLALGLLFRQAGHNQTWKDAAALLAGLSAIALVLSSNMGLPGVGEMDVRADAFGAIAAELLILVTWVVSRATGHEYDEVSA